MDIRSVRQGIPAPQEPIMGGALQGFGTFANNMAAQKQQEQDQQSKLGLALLTAYAQQDRTITPGGTGGIQYGGQNYAIGDKSQSTSDIIKRQKHGLDPMTTDTKRLLAENMAKDQLGKKWNWLKKSTSKSAKQRQQAQEQYDNLVNFFMEKGVGGDVGGGSARPDFNSFGSPNASAQAFFNQGNQRTKQITKPKYLPGPDGNDIEVTQEDWDSATPEEQQSLLNAYGL